MKASRRRVSGVLLCLVLCSACGGSSTSSSAPPAPTLGASEKTIDARWTVDPKSVACVKENLDTTCHYLYRGVHFTVSYDQHGDAEQIIAGGLSGHVINMWHFLNGLIPKGSHVYTCRYIPHSSGGGIAHACIYHGQSDVIVAYFPHPNDPDYVGLVAYDYASFRDISPENTS